MTQLVFSQDQFVARLPRILGPSNLVANITSPFKYNGEGWGHTALPCPVRDAIAQVAHDNALWQLVAHMGLSGEALLRFLEEAESGASIRHLPSGHEIAGSVMFGASDPRLAMLLSGDIHDLGRFPLMIRQGRPIIVRRSPEPVAAAAAPLIGIEIPPATSVPVADVAFEVPCVSKADATVIVSAPAPDTSSVETTVVPQIRQIVLDRPKPRTARAGMIPARVRLALAVGSSLAAAFVCVAFLADARAPTTIVSADPTQSQPRIAGAPAPLRVAAQSETVAADPAASPPSSVAENRPIAHPASDAPAAREAVLSDPPRPQSKTTLRADSVNAVKPATVNTALPAGQSEAAKRGVIRNDSPDMGASKPVERPAKHVVDSGHPVKVAETSLAKKATKASNKRIVMKRVPAPAREASLSLPDVLKPH